MKFVCDAMLGRLAKYLRALGFDTTYLKKSLELSENQNNDTETYFLTRKSHISQKNNVIVIRSVHVKDQLVEIGPIILEHFRPELTMSRCMRCNEQLCKIPRAEAEHVVPEFVFHRCKEFKSCRSCGKIYWAGSHKSHMNGWIQNMLEEIREDSLLCR